MGGQGCPPTPVIDLTTDEECLHIQRQKRRKKDDDVVKKCTLPFQLLKTRGIPKKFQHGPLGFDLAQHVSGDIKVAFVSNYMMDIPWLVDTCPDLFFSDKLVLVHGQQGANGAMRKQLKMLGVEDADVVCPWVPPYGTHHTKAFFLQYKKGIRIIIHTANLMYCDVNNKSQSVFMQDFPLKELGDAVVSDFEAQLVQYIGRLELGHNLREKIKNMISMHDYRYARGHIVSSVPSKPYEFETCNQYGHVRVASILKNEVFDAAYAQAPIIAQFSSIGNISGKFMKEMTTSFSAGHFVEHTPPPPVQLIWPTVAEVRDSLEGFFGGGSLCGYPNRFQKAFVMEKIHRWGGQAAGRQRALPHMKTYLRYIQEQEGRTKIPWVLLASHNFSKAAWGEVVQSKKYNTKLFRILSYEMGILLVPRLELAYRNSPQCGFSCTDDDADTDPPCREPYTPRIDAVEFIPWKIGSVEDEYMEGNVLMVPIPLPFDLPPNPYPSNPSDPYESIPWTVIPDPTHGDEWQGIDALGNSYPGKGSYQGTLKMMYKKTNPKEKYPSLGSLQSESFYIVKIDAPPGVEVPGGCYVTVQSGPHLGLKVAFERLRDPKPRAHTLPDIVFLPSNSSVLVLDETVPMKPHLIVQKEVLDRARMQQNPEMMITRAIPVSARATEIPANLTTPPGKLYRPARLAYTDEKGTDEHAAEKRQKAGNLSPKALHFEEGKNQQQSTTDGAMDNVSALRAACTAKLMWMLSNSYEHAQPMMTKDQTIDQQRTQDPPLQIEVEESKREVEGTEDHQDEILHITKSADAS